MGLFNVHIHSHIPTEYFERYIGKLLHEIKHSKQTIMGQLDDIKGKLALQDSAIDGLAADLAFIKAKLANAEGGLTAAEVAELNTLIDERTAKLQALDAQTDPLAGEPDPDAPTE